MTIGIIGLGYVGLTLAIAAADSGITVYGVETNPHIKECLSQNRAHFFEPGLDLMITEHNLKDFFCVEQFPKDIKFDAFIITVGTPLKKGGAKKPTYEYIKSAIDTIRHVYTGDQLVILRSTVSVGTTRNVILPLLKQLCGRPEEEILISMCPERTVEGKAIKELKSLPQVISGNNDKSLQIAHRLFSQITTEIVSVDTLEEAELVKLYCNTYRDMTFALGNVLCMAAQEFGVDGSKVITAANKGYQRANIPMPGFVAGPCLEKDAYILTSNMPKSASRDFILSTRRFNESMEEAVVKWVERQLGSGTSEKIIALSGMAFKGVPETSDLRGSSSVSIAQKLAAKGFTLKLHDYVAWQGELKELSLGQVSSNLEELCVDADLLIVLNNHIKYAEAELDRRACKESLVILDTWNVCRKLRESGFKYYTLGNISIDKEVDVLECEQF